MKSIRNFSSVAFIALVVSIASNGASFAQEAQKPTYESTVARVEGSMTGGKIDTVKYSITCPEFKFDMDASAIQDATSRSFVEEQAKKFQEIRGEWQVYEDCLTINARRDSEALSQRMADDITKQQNEVVLKFNAIAINQSKNLERAKKMKLGKSKDPNADIVPDTYVKSEERFVGSFTEGKISDVHYIPGCPDIFGGLTSEDFDNSQTVAHFNNLITKLNNVRARIQDYTDCLNVNYPADLKMLVDIINDGVNVTYIPAQQNFEDMYQKVQRQLNLQREPGGLLAPHASAAPAAKKTAPPASKKKK